MIALYRIFKEIYTGKKPKGFHVALSDKEKQLFLPEHLNNPSAKHLIDYYIDTLTKEIGSPEYKGFDNGIYKSIRSQDEKEKYYYGTCGNIFEKQFRILTMKTLQCEAGSHEKVKYATMKYLVTENRDYLKDGIDECFFIK